MHACTYTRTHASGQHTNVRAGARTARERERERQTDRQTDREREREIFEMSKDKYR